MTAPQISARYSTHAFASTSCAFSSPKLKSRCCSSHRRKNRRLNRRHLKRDGEFCCASSSDTGETISENGSAKPSEASPFPLLSFANDSAREQLLSSSSYTHVSPGVCDAHASDVAIRAAWVVLLRSQHPSHRANAKRTKDMFHQEDESFLERYHEWERKYDMFLSSVESDAYQGGTLLNVVSEKE